LRSGTQEKPITWARHFSARTASPMKMPFGRWKGTPVCDLDDDYLRWLDSKTRFAGPTAISGDRGDGAPELCADAPRQLEAWCRRSSRREDGPWQRSFTSDAGGSTEKMQVLNSTADWLKSRMLMVI